MASEAFDAYALPTASPPRPHPADKKSWSKLRLTVRETRKSITRLTSAMPSNFQFRPIETEAGQPMTRLYLLGDIDKSRESTLLKVDIPETPLDMLPNYAREEEEDTNMEDTEAGSSQHSSRQPTYIMSPVFGTQPAPMGGGAVPMSKEEQLLRERKRLGTYGITSYESYLKDGLFIIPAHNSLYKCHDDPGIACVPVEILTCAKGARLDPKICPCNPDLLTFINDKDIWLTCLNSGKEVRLTEASKAASDPRTGDSPVSAGVPSFVMQEEFDRYTGYWWSPQRHYRTDDKHVYHILYEEVDESEVEIVSIFSPSNQDSSETYRYPRAGTRNATSELVLLELTVTYTGRYKQRADVQTTEYRLKDSLFDACPWAEYLTRVGWTPDGKHIYAVVLDRSQMRQAVMLIPIDCFYHSDGRPRAGPIPPIQCIYEESSDVWINVNDIIHFFPRSSERSISFLYASEKSGYRHLYLVTSRLQSGSGHVPMSHHIGQGDGAGSYAQCQVESEIPVTAGQWVVLPKEIWVDKSRGLVYFMGTMDSPLETHLYVASYRHPHTPIRLTAPGFSHTVHLSEDLSKFVTVFSCLDMPPQSAIFRLEHDRERGIACNLMGYLTRKSGEAANYRPPVPFCYQSRAGHVAHGLYFVPKGLEHGKRYPTVLFVYGGPCVQMVTNSWKGQKFLRLHTLAADGYAVVVIDGRGSTNRGLAFESVLKNQLGSVEIEDQVEGLLWLASQTQFIDLSRVAIYGWSYGGYLSLMGLAKRPDIFKVAVAGAPVISWELYDTGYTERYIGLPQSNKDVYKAGSVLNYIESLPDDDTRLLLIHSLKDENVHFHHSSVLINQLVKCCKPYQLQTYPNERHGIRDNDANEHYKTTVLKFLQDYL